MRDRLQGLLQQPVRTARDADRIREAADLLAEYLRLEARAERVIDVQPAPAAGTDTQGLTLDDAAERVLEAAGVPLHVNELGTRIKAGGWRHPRSRNARPQQIFFQLASRLPRHPDRFRRVAPNTFALTRWEAEDGARRRKRPPRTGLFHGPGAAVGQAIGDSDEAAEAEQTAWRSS